MRRVLAVCLLVGTATLGVQGSAEAHRLPACKYEDGSGQPACVWDARHMGNGSGDSLVFRDWGKTVNVVSHRRAHHLAFGH